MLAKSNRFARLVKLSTLSSFVGYLLLSLLWWHELSSIGSKFLKAVSPIALFWDGNHHICWYGMCHFWRAFCRADYKFRRIIFGKITSGNKF